MYNNLPIKDYVTSGSEGDLKLALENLQDKIALMMDWVDANCIRNDESIALLNLLSANSQCANIFHTSIGNHISILALATRNLYELNLTTRSIIKSKENLNNWNSEAITDKIQVLEGILSIHTASDLPQQRKILTTEINRLKDLRKKYELPEIKTPASAGQVAKDLESTDEHKSLYKLFSKIVHPSSYLVNDHKNSASIETIMILQIQGQIYIHDTLSKISEHLNIPDTITEQA
ncbi:DUF5677 domain-containing protein [Pseudomonas sp. FH1]|uniref:DUF5677 domain-containing protein n=1 Tax=Pseudomonas sp. FH1 TaxID=1284392 RepID=UPI0003DB6A72|nr:DUF5677 domain-containing protein [Pseudomonas sp. FH1]ETK24515.1 hypothetical protein H096_05202 [Pseudomonas sp. FH1]